MASATEFGGGIARQRPGLRERKRAAAMNHIQEIAVDLFEERGFDAVTIEEIADVAQVSARSVYRYFRTKEGLVLRDAMDDQFVAVLPTYLREQGSLLEAARAALKDFRAAMGRDLPGLVEESNRRLRIWYATPSIRVAAFGIADEMAAQIADDMVSVGMKGRSPDDCRVEAAALIFGFFAGLERWFENGMKEDVFDVADRVIDVLEGSV